MVFKFLVLNILVSQYNKPPNISMMKKFCVAVSCGNYLLLLLKKYQDFNGSLWSSKYFFMRHATINKLKLFKKNRLFLAITYFLCSIDKKTLNTVVLLLVLEFRFWSVNYTLFIWSHKIFSKIVETFIYKLLSKFCVKIINHFKVMVFKQILNLPRIYVFFP